MFDWFEIVPVVRCDKFPEVVNQQGYVCGKSFSEEDAGGGPAANASILGYGVLLFTRGKVHSFGPEDIKATGYMVAVQRNKKGWIEPQEVPPR